MPRNGPIPKPTAVEIAEGKPHQHAVNAFEPEFDRVIPECPRHLTKPAKGYWDELAPMLFRSKMLTEADQIALGNLCQAYATLAQAQRKLARSGLVSKTGGGVERRSPLFNIVMDSMKIINQLCAEFGMTPSARSRLRVGKKEKAADPLDNALFSGGADLLVLPKRDQVR